MVSHEHVDRHWTFRGVDWSGCGPRAAAREFRTSSRLAVAITVATLTLTGCAAEAVYSRAAPGTLEGDLQVRWVDNDCFVFEPNPEKPFRFTRAPLVGGASIQPGRMYTDGGSVPRVLWGFPQFSPWGYAPAYIVHDWLFAQKHCGDPAQVTFEESAKILLEVLRTQMDANESVKNVKAAYLIYRAVQTRIAQEAWDRPGCDPPRAEARALRPDAAARAALASMPLVLDIRDGQVPRLTGPSRSPPAVDEASAAGLRFWAAQCPSASE